MLKIFRIIIVMWAIGLTAMSGASNMEVDYENTSERDGGLPHMYFTTSENNSIFEGFLMKLDGFTEQ